MTANRKQLQQQKIKAIQLLKQNRLAEAEQALLALAPSLGKDKVLWLELGRIRITQGRHSEALEFLEKAVTNAPKSAEARLLLGMANQSCGNISRAIACFEKGAQIEPKNIEFNIRLGHAYTGINNNMAISWFKKAQARQPGNIAVATGLARVYSTRGDVDDAYKILSPFLHKQPLDLHITIAFATICRPLKRCQQAIELLTSALQGKKSTADQCNAHFSLGKLYDLQDEYELAFKHYQLANSIAGKTYTPAPDKAFFNGMISTMNSDFFTRAPRATIATNQKKIIFIVGMPRSGSTLIEQILATHTSVYAAGELGEVASIAASIPTEVNDPAGYPSCLEKLDSDVVNRLTQRYLEFIADISADSSSIVIDKMPDNFRFLGFIQLLFPNARIIHCRRNPLDTCLSCYFQNFEGGHSYSSDLENLGIYYRMYKKLMAHWKNTLELPLLDIEYEQLVQNPEDISKKLFEFCELEWSPDCLEYFKNSRSVVTASYDQVRQPIYQGSIDRWKNYEPYLQPLQNALAAN